MFTGNPVFITGYPVMCTGYPVPILTGYPVLSTGDPVSHGISRTNPTGYPPVVYGDFSREVDYHRISRHYLTGYPVQKDCKQKRRALIGS